MRRPNFERTNVAKEPLFGRRMNRTNEVLKSDRDSHKENPEEELKVEEEDEADHLPPIEDKKVPVMDFDNGPDLEIEGAAIRVMESRTSLRSAAKEVEEEKEKIEEANLNESHMPLNDPKQF